MPRQRFLRKIVLETCCVQLANMSAHLPMVRKTMIDKDAVDALLGVAKGNPDFDVENQRASIIALTNLAVDMECKPVMIQKGCIEVLVELCKSPKEPNDFRIACQVLVLRGILALTCECDEACNKVR